MGRRAQVRLGVDALFESWTDAGSKVTAAGGQSRVSPTPARPDESRNAGEPEDSGPQRAVLLTSCHRTRRRSGGQGVVAVVRTETSALVVLSASGVPQGRFPLDRDRVRIGRDPAADLALQAAGVSWNHAALTRSGDHWFVRDLGSTNGTWVGDVRISGPTEVGPGARITVGELTLVVEGHAGPGHPPTEVLPSVPAGGGIGVRDQHGQQINNVEGLAYIQHVQNVQHVQQQRESFFREVARTRTKARWFVWLGLVILVLGIVTTTATGLSSVREIFGAVASQSEPDPSSFNPFGRTVGGFPLLEIGYAAAFLGMLMIVIGIVLHVVATARRRSVDQRYPMPPPQF
jgi:uncharacterized membrane protein